MSGSDYQSHASRLNAKATAAHKAWVAGLNAEQRANLKRLKILDVDDDSHEVGGHSPMQTADIADSPLARCDPDYAALIDGEAGALADRFGVTYAIAEAILAHYGTTLAAALRTHEADLLSVVVGGLLSSKNVRIACGGLAFASGMVAANALGSQADYARSIGVSRTIISKSVKAWQRQLNLRPSNFQKSEAACETYSAVAKDRHWRKQKVSASELARRIKSNRRPKS
jgi:hypothetical protein